VLKGQLMALLRSGPGKLNKPLGGKSATSKAL